MSTYTITLNNGVQLANLTMNGTMYVSHDEVTRDILTAEALKTVTISETSDGQVITTTLHDAVCDNILHWPEGWLFNLREPSENDMLLRQIEALNTDLTNTQMALVEVYEMIGG